MCCLTEKKIRKNLPPEINPALDDVNNVQKLGMIRNIFKYHHTYSLNNMKINEFIIKHSNIYQLCRCSCMFLLPKEQAVVLSC